MALKQGSSSGVDAVDVKYVLAAFQEMNRCVLTVLLRVSGTSTSPVLNLEMVAGPKESVAAEPVPLACHKSTIGLSGARTLEAAILQGLYGLDAEMAGEELAKTIAK